MGGVVFSSPAEWQVLTVPSITSFSLPGFNRSYEMAVAYFLNFKKTLNGALNLKSQIPPSNRLEIKTGTHFSPLWDGCGSKQKFPA